ncbi:methyltransferase domain-containing protein [Magnetococcus sp. PR-3]|uniref:methyltransferase domain-containing protein n=1 Tax=Magnetococcus sp. PR-3 TaxID=3120355 RepID=UPI002FCDF65B
MQPMVQMPTPVTAKIDPKRVRRILQRALPNAPLQDGPVPETAVVMAERLSEMRIQPKRLLLLGCRDTVLTQAIEKQWPKAQLITQTLEPGWAAALRPAPTRKLFKTVQAPFLCSGLEELPYADGSFDGVISNLTLHWSPDMKKTLAEIRRVLRGNGFLLASQPGSENFRELRAALAQLDQQNHGKPLPRLPRAVDIQDVGDLLASSGYTLPFTDKEGASFPFPNLESLLEEFRFMGTGNPHLPRATGLAGRNWLQQLEAIYRKQQQVTENGPIPVSLDIIFSLGWKAEDPGGNNMYLPKTD